MGNMRNLYRRAISSNSWNKSPTFNNGSMKQSAPEAEFALHCRAHKLTPETEFRFNPARKWRFDFAWPEQKLGVEINGAVWVVGVHSTGAGITRDYEKGNSAALLGWRVSLHRMW